MAPKAPTLYQSDHKTYLAFPPTTTNARLLPGCESKGYKAIKLQPKHTNETKVITFVAAILGNAKILNALGFYGDFLQEKSFLVARLGQKEGAGLRRGGGGYLQVSSKTPLLS